MSITFTNYMKNVIDAVRTLIQNEFDADGIATLIGDTELIPVPACIVIEPVIKKTESEYTNTEKEVRLTLEFYIYLYDANQENAIIRLTATAERLEQLLLNNKKYPSGSGASWNNSFVTPAEYGSRKNGGEFFRAAKMKWDAVLWAAR